MTYIQFVQAVERKVKEEVKGHVIVCVHTADKNNGVQRRGLMLTEKGVNISPTIYLEEYYQQFRGGSSVESIAADILRLYGEIRFQKSWSGEWLMDYEAAKEKLVFRLIGGQKNQKMLSDIPHVMYLDFAVVFYVLVEATEFGMANMMVRKEHLEKWGIDQEELYRKACENTPRLLPYELQAMEAVLENLTGEVVPEIKKRMFILSNKKKSFGAAAILYPRRLEWIGELLGEDYYVLPSSVHETILLPASEGYEQEELSRMVWEINRMHIEPEEVLSDHAYFYDRKERVLRM